MLGGVELILTGNDWTDRQFLERLSKRLGIESAVTFTGRREETAMEIVCEADLVLLPSRFDGFGLCIVAGLYLQAKLTPVWFEESEKLF